MTAYLLMVGMFLGCGEKEAPQSRPVAGDAKENPAISSINMNTDEPKPVGIAAVSAKLPAIIDLPVEGKQAVVAALNLVPAPCQACKDETIARCLMDSGVSDCTVLNKLTRRAVRMAKNGSLVDTIKIEINYPDFWFPYIGSGRPVTVHLYNDPEGSFAADVSRIRGRLLEIFGPDIRMVDHVDLSEDVSQLGVRTRPTWFINGHRFRGVQSVDGLARFISYELADGP